MSIKSETQKRMSKTQLENTVQHYTKEYQEQQNNYRSQNGKTAAAVLDLCKVVFEASVALKNKNALKSFKEQNKLKDKGTFSQYRTIGEHYDRLSPHASSLPSSWYTLYRIAKLDANTRDSAIANGKLHAFTTQREVRELSGAATAPRPKSEVAGSENSDRTFSGNSGRLALTPSGHTLAAGGSEGRDVGHAQAASDSGSARRGSQSAGGREAGDGLRAKRSSRRG